jgi:hypothetical protein
MISTTGRTKRKWVAVTAVFVSVLGIWSATLSTLVVAQSQTRNQSQRFWIAARYDGNRIFVYFDNVKRESFPEAHPLESGVDGSNAPLFQLTAPDVARLQTASMERFSLADQYDLVGSNRGLATLVTLTTLIGAETSLYGDPSIGAIATVKDAQTLEMLNNNSDGHYVIRRHQGPRGVEPPIDQSYFVKAAELLSDPVPLETQTRILALLTDRMRSEVQADLTHVEQISPIFSVQSFRISGGAIRYYARALWRRPDDSDGQYGDALGAWISPEPTLHILAVEEQTSGGGFDVALPRLLNVVDLGAGRTSMIIDISGEESSGLVLMEYRDGANTSSMRSLNSIHFGE